MTNTELCEWLRGHSSGVYRPSAEAAERIEELSAQVDRLLAHCPDYECHTCGEIICPYGEPLHFHHDGCPACAENEADERDQSAATRFRAEGGNTKPESDSGDADTVDPQQGERNAGHD